MPDRNGHPALGVLTLELLEYASTEWIRLPALSERLGLQGRPPEDSGERHALREHLEKAAAALREGREPPAWPEALAALSGAYVKICTIGRADEQAFLPPAPPGSDDWPKDDEAAFRRCYQEWLDSLPEAEREERQRRLSEVVYKVAALGTVEPAMTAEQAKRLGQDAAFLAEEIRVFSGLVQRGGADAGAAEPSASRSA